MGPTFTSGDPQSVILFPEFFNDVAPSKEVPRKRLSTKNKFLAAYAITKLTKGMGLKGFKK